VWGKNCAVFVLAQGLASVDLRPSRSRLEAIVPQGERFVGQVMRGPVWDGLLREYYYERVFVDITVHRVATWPDLSASGDLRAFGATWPGPAGPQVPPKNGTGPRMDVDRAAGRIGMLPHRVLAYRGADGFPVVVPVEFAGHDAAGLRLVSTRGLLPPGGRRAACSPTPTGRSWSGSPPGPSPVAGGGRRWQRGLRPAYLQGLCRPATQETAAGVQWAVRQIRALAGRRHGTAKRLEQLAAHREQLTVGI
jgi:hypothetical protein